MNSQTMQPTDSKRLSRRRFGSLFRVLLLARPYTRTLILALTALLVGSLINLSIPEIIRRLLNSQSIHSLLSHPYLISALLIGVFLIQAVAFYLRSYWFGVVGHRAVFDLRRKLFASILTKPLEFFDSSRTGDLLSRLSADTSMIQDVVSLRISVCVRYAVQVIVGIGLMVYISRTLTLYIIIIVPVLVLTAKILGKKLRSLTKQQQEKLGTASNDAEQAISGIRTVKAFNGESHELSRYHRAIESVRELGFYRSHFSGVFSSSVNFLMNASLVIVLMIGLRQVTSGIMTAGDLTAFLLYGAIVAISFAFLAGSIGELYQASGAAERIFDTLSVAGEFDVPDIEALRLTSPPDFHSVTFQQVSFSYPSRPETKALSNLSFTLRPNSFTALVGPSGSGKSTVTNLLLRFYPPQSGSILFDEKTISEFSPAAIRSCIGLVPQDPLLFADTIEANLRYGAPEASEGEMMGALEKSSLREFIDSLPDGLQTYVGERGIQLSGGQKQRLAIARAILSKPKILILDEATSALDSESESLIQKAISRIRSECIVLAIAHRIATIQNADQIIVLHKGQIAQQGDHSSLIEQEGIYKEFVTYQTLLA